MPQIRGYQVVYMSSNNHPWTAEIRCYEHPEDAREGTIIRFYDTTPIPHDASVNGIPVLNYALHRFSDVVSILRDEDYVWVDGFQFETAAGPSGERCYGVMSPGATPGDMNP